MTGKISLKDLGKAALFAKQRPSIPEVKISISGGVLSGISSTGPVRILVYDFDNLEDGHGEDDCSPSVHSFGEGGEVL